MNDDEKGLRDKPVVVLWLCAYAVAEIVGVLLLGQWLGWI